MTLQEYLANKTHRHQVLPVNCKDGLRLSVQTSQYHYCTPRQDQGPWTHVEVGYPSQRVEELMPWVEDPENPTQTVYGYVPVEVVETLIEARGGMEQ